MSDPKLTIKLLEQVEGIRSNEANDKGKDTVFGITETFDADWPGWAVVHHLDAIHTLKDTFPDHPELMSLVAMHYQAIIDKLGVVVLGQALANAIVGAYVNEGPTAIGILQKVLLSLGAKVKVDYHMQPGGETLKACQTCGEETAYTNFYNAREVAYEQIAKNHPAMEPDLKGWINRLKAGA